MTTTTPAGFAKNLDYYTQFLMFVEDIKTAQKLGEAHRMQEVSDWGAEAISEIIRANLAAYPGQWAEA